MHAPHRRANPACSLWASTPLRPHRCQAASLLLSAGVAASLAFAPPAHADLASQRAEREAALQAQMEKLAYALQQQDTARKAELLGK